MGKVEVAGGAGNSDSWLAHVDGWMMKRAGGLVFHN